MFDGPMQVEAGGSIGREGDVGRVAWREVDRKLREVARRRSALDHEELALIREAIRVLLWRELGMVSIREYLEHVMGYGPNVASERVRVAEALDAMPVLERALETGVLPYSAVRGITRIATRKTEAAWVKACRGKNLRQIEELLAEREPGDRPEDPRNPDLRLQTVTYRYPPHVIAMIRQCRAKLESELGERIDDGQLGEAMARAFLGGGAGAASKAPTQIAISVCPSCKVARQSAAGVEVAIAPEVLERAACDAQWLGDVDGERARAVQDITPAVRKVVRARDRDRCRVPGCRSARNIDVHHIVHREHGGSHATENLVLLCSGHHAAHHEGRLVIRGTAEALEVMRLGAGAHDVDEQPADGVASGAASTFHVESAADNASDLTALHADVTQALVRLGCSRAKASRAVREAITEDGRHDVEGVLRAALRRCSS